MEHAGHSHAAVSVFARVQELTARNLHLLQAIENTLAALASDTKLLAAMGDSFAEILENLEANAPEDAFDADGRVCNVLSLAADTAQRIYTRAEAKHQAARNDQRLTDDDGVAFAYEEYLSEVERLFDVVESLKDWIETHDAILEQSTGKTYKNVDDLFAAMGL